MTSGEYIGPGGLFKMRGYPEKRESSDSSRDPNIARRLWQVLEELTDGIYNLLEPDLVPSQ